MKAFVVGGSGFAGGELLRLLIGHPQVEHIETTSRKFKGKEVSDVHPNLRGQFDGKFTEFNPGKVDADVAFLALPHGQSMEHAPKLLDKGIKVVDIGADFRIRDLELFESYYCKHTCKELLKVASYGLPELFRNDIKDSRLVANPGCYATAAILSLAPLAGIKGAELGRVIVDAKSGTSGAGINAEPSWIHHSEVSENLKSYKVTGHRHEPEMEHVLCRLASGFRISFTPSMVPTVRGILSNAHVFCDLTAGELKSRYEEFYKKEGFVRIVDAAQTKSVLHSNFCDLSVHYDAGKKRAVIVSAIDNLVKGAAGQAVQNMNLIMGFTENEGLGGLPFHP